MEDIDKTLEERGKVYGSSFLEQAQVAQLLKTMARNSPNYNRMRVDQRESTDMILTKLSRILNGDPNDVDSWRDIAGYARLIMVELESTIHTCEKKQTTS